MVIPVTPGRKRAEYGISWDQAPKLTALHVTISSPRPSITIQHTACWVRSQQLQSLHWAIPKDPSWALADARSVNIRLPAPMQQEMHTELCCHREVNRKGGGQVPSQRGAWLRAALNSWPVLGTASHGVASRDWGHAEERFGESCLAQRPEQL